MKKNVKSEKGVTLASLIIYIVAMLVIIALISTVSLFFYDNMLSIDSDNDKLVEFNKFNTYFLEETKKAGNKITSEMNQESHTITFSDDITFTFNEEEKAIYRNEVKICENIANCSFKANLTNGKEIVEVKLVIVNSEKFAQTFKYVLNSTE